jgi:SulP family sulfate permease
MSTLFRMEPMAVPTVDGPVPVRVLRLYGSLFFGAVGKVEDLPEQLPLDTRVLVLEMQRLVSIDTSGLDALVQLRRALARRHISLVLCEVNEQPASLLQRSGRLALFGPRNVVPDLIAAAKRAAELLQHGDTEAL